MNEDSPLTHPSGSCLLVIDMTSHGAIETKPRTLKLSLLGTLLVLALVSGSGSTPASAASFNHAADYSTTDNPNDPWSYRYVPGATVPSSSTLLPEVVGSAWHLPRD